MINEQQYRVWDAYRSPVSFNNILSFLSSYVLFFGIFLLLCLALVITECWEKRSGGIGKPVFPPFKGITINIIKRESHVMYVHMQCIITACYQWDSRASFLSTHYNTTKEISIGTRCSQTGRFFFISFSVQLRNHWLKQGFMVRQHLNK